jgi:Tol biopolymer transport system component
LGALEGSTLAIAWPARGGGLILVTRKDATGKPSQVWHYAIPGGEWTQLTHDPDGYYSSVLSAIPAGTAVAVLKVKFTSSLWVARADGTAAHQVGPTVRELGGTLSWTGDGRILSSRSEDIYLINQDGTGKSSILNDVNSNENARACGEGGNLVYTSRRSKKAEVWTADLNGRSQKYLADGNFPDCSPDGQWVAFFTTGAENIIWNVPIRGGTPERLATSNVPPGWSPLYSRDSKSISYLAGVKKGDGLQTEVRTMDLASHAVHAVPYPKDAAGIWRKEEKGFFALGYPNGVPNVWSYSAEGKPVKAITDFKYDAVYDFDFSRDGKSLAIIRGQSSSDPTLIRIGK